MSLWHAILASLLPISELRGGIPIAIANNIKPVVAYTVCVFFNILVIPIVFFFLDYIHKYLVQIRFYRNTFNSHLERNIKKIEKHMGTKWEFIVLMLFVGIPLPITGAYTGTLLAWFFKINRKKAYVALSLGVLIAGIIVSIVSVLGINTLRFLIK
ncbi:MAG: small multi-drug export protein [Nanoarchaeota archaeon]|nr:small multi-drug export protein [Nanoarchaeota archaeon]